MENRKKGVYLALLLLIILFLTIANTASFVITGEATTRPLSMNISILTNVGPEILYISSEILVCENDFLDYYFNITDVNGDTLSVDLNPKAPLNPFYIMFFSNVNSTVNQYLIYSGTLNKTNSKGVNAGFKVYGENVSVTDGLIMNSTMTNITVIEVNNAPVIANIGVQTVSVSGEDNNFYYETLVTDSESGNQNSGNLSFNLSFSGAVLFNISNIGAMNFTPNLSQLGVHNITLCVADSGLISPHQNISLCEQTGSNQTSCINFSLTVTNDNRAPNITSYFPLNASLNANGTQSLYFNITKYDLDLTIPDTDWFVDSVLIEEDSGSLFDEFIYSFGCGISGNHAVKAVITDGELNDSVQWSVNVSSVACPPEGGGGGGGGGGAGLPEKTCVSKWVCDEWEQCKNLEQSFEEISFEDKISIKGMCTLFDWNEKICGFQRRNCKDVNNCEEKERLEEIKKSEKEINVSFPKPDEEILKEDVYEPELPLTSEEAEKECISDFSCDDWSRCLTVYNLKDVSAENVSLKEEQYRKCEDLNNCVSDKIERKKCRVEKTIFLKDIGNYIEVYDREQENLVSRLELTNGKLNIQIPLDRSEYNFHCFDGIQNYNEDEVDCVYQGESCPLCVTELPSLRGDYFLMIITLIVLVSSCFFLVLWYLALGKKIKKTTKKILNMSRTGKSDNFLKSKKENTIERIKNKLSFLNIKNFIVLGLIFGIIVLSININYSFGVTGNAVDNSFSSVKLEIIRECYYTDSPDCEDNIKNCHDGKCEELVDCGGPCSPCPSCSDGIQNQGEDEVDCGGPCFSCISEIATISNQKSFIYIFLIILLGIIILIIRALVKYYRNKKQWRRFRKGWFKS